MPNTRRNPRRVPSDLKLGPAKPIASTTRETENQDVPGEGVEPPRNRSAVGHISRSVTPASACASGETVLKLWSRLLQVCAAPSKTKFGWPDPGAEFAKGDSPFAFRIPV